ncbi:MAG: 23S rRNA (guanosine(2251)-2'-O)-methyltransferase RlmB [Solobacterium sp.]|nr:23S rRNA (guanosine(2251)-2'-O)-methyltransferase RlmB [Solobacterium sp.]
MSQFIYGKNPVKQILLTKQGVLEVFLSQKDKEIEEACRKANVSVQIVDKKTLQKLAGSSNHQGVVAKIEDYKTYEVDDLVEAKHSEYGLIILLDELEDPHNLGAILRTADAVGADGVIFKKTHNVGLTPTVAKVSTGAIHTVKCAPVTNLVRTVQDLKKKGYWIVGTDMKGEDYRSLKYDFHTVLVIGNEGKGISRLLKEECDYTVTIPMIGSISSLNASVSTGILLYEICGRRHVL